MGERRDDNVPSTDDRIERLGRRLGRGLSILLAARLYSICGIDISLTEFSPHLRSVRQRKWLQLFKTIAGTGIIPVCLAAEVMHDAPHRIERGLNRALDPARNP
jgi:hypothetical protein